MACQYATHVDYWVKLDLETSELMVRYGETTLVQNLVFSKEGSRLIFTEATTERNQEFTKLIAKYQVGAEAREVIFSVNSKGVTVKAPETLRLKGASGFGAEARPMSLSEHDFFRSGFGTACSTLDDMLFDVTCDRGLVIAGDCGKRFIYNREAKRYDVDALLKGDVVIKLEENLYGGRYEITYAPVNKNATFKKPPVGWMTWYALKYTVTEENVLANAKWLSDNLGRFGVDTVWIDWEWCHDRGVADNLRVDANRYPNGLKFVADKIKEYGLVPSLWIGFSTERTENDYMREHPEIVLAVEPYWCGEYFFDISHPTYMDDYLPKALSQVDEWGFEAIKFDTLAPGIRAQERFHQHMYDPDMTSKEAYRKVATITRDVLGKDRYMLSCCAVNDSDILWACDKFEAARVGADVFNWEEFINNAVKRVARYYPFHNVVFYNDADCVIARDEYSTIDQVKSRTAFISMLGLPVTLGDDMPTLQEERVEIIKRSIPVLDIHTMDVDRHEPSDVAVTGLVIDTELQNYSIVSVFNTTEKALTKTVTLAELGIDGENSLYYEYYSGETMDIEDGSITATLKPFETKIYAVREKTAHPQVISTNRHVTQGIIEISAMAWAEESRTLSMTADLVGRDLYTVSVCIPEGYQFKEQKGFDSAEVKDSLLTLSVTASENETRDFEVVFA